MSDTNQRLKAALSAISWTTTLGLLATFIWVLIGIGLIVERKDSVSGLNELGDFLAGMAGPLALFWLVLGFFQQQKELRQNTVALNYQREELERTADEQARLANNSTLQTELLVSPFVAVRLGQKNNRNGRHYREVWAQNIGAQAAYFGHSVVNLSLLKNEIADGFWCAGDEHYFEVGEMTEVQGHLSIDLYNRNGDLVVNVIQFHKGENGVPSRARLIASQTIAEGGVTNVNTAQRSDVNI